MVTREEVKTILAQTLSMSVAELADETPLDGGEIESLSYVEMLLAIESHYGITASDDELESVKNIGNLSQLIVEKIYAIYQQ
ncbi:acyl carrier protein [Dolichospermum circinale]|uniref:Acyl carrier protein n=1 Tax=Dolichospermum circinale CS-537/01 TaxID=3021739 RepID=A0ABT5A437_9CYAN|nr:acyl carrier protein [Dolichospermum circinale]MDB9456227.1 acyl carrier protein [Dolichospermum circinale CS-541/06]MDB9464839.1 acyl carrier protein [Dolichospermum circinale CS-541/04]MDB9486692.1 acyl carrier protein [Dolichospermum circinale CS-537/01]MDB9547141.1 acyl carrier protein [Dolichospermum circinale CS-1031]